MNRKSGMTLMELLAGAVIAFAIMAAIGLRARNIAQRAKASSARAAVGTIGLSLGMMKDDTGLYP